MGRALARAPQRHWTTDRFGGWVVDRLGDLLSRPFPLPGWHLVPACEGNELQFVSRTAKGNRISQLDNIRDLDVKRYENSS